MEQEVQYCTLADGMRIAFSIVGGGSGVPLMFATPAPFSTITEPWRNLGVTEVEATHPWPNDRHWGGGYGRN